MLTGLLVSAFLMGLAGIPHCAAMCATPCAALLPSGVSAWSIAGRSFGYALLGAVAAAAASTLARWSQVAALLQPIWLMVLLASVMLGVWLVLKGEMPLRIQAQGMVLYRWVQQRHGPGSGQGRRWMSPLVLGMAWAALPCGLLYGALTVAALSPHAWGGAVVMLAFSIPGAVVLAGWPRLLARWRRSGVPLAASEGVDRPQLAATVPVLWQPGVPAPSATASATTRIPTAWAFWADGRLALRLSGACLVGGAGWALSHRLMTQWQAWCA